MNKDRHEHACVATESRLDNVIMADVLFSGRSTKRHGFDSPNGIQADSRHLERHFLLSVACSLDMGGAYGEPQGSPVPVSRSINPYAFALQFDSWRRIAHRYRSTRMPSAIGRTLPVLSHFITTCHDPREPRFAAEMGVRLGA